MSSDNITLTYLAFVSVNEYLSNEFELPELVPEKTFTKLVPSCETEMMKLYCTRAPSTQAMSTLHIGICAPKSAVIQGLRVDCDAHLVRRFRSIAFSGGNDGSLLFAVTAFILWGPAIILLQVFGFGGSSSNK